MSMIGRGRNDATGSGDPERPKSCTGRSGAGRQRARARAGNWSGATGPGGGRAGCAAEAAAPLGWSDAPLPELGSAPPERYGMSATDRSESCGPESSGAGQQGDTVATGSSRDRVPARDGGRWDDALSSTARFAPMPDLPSRASAVRDDIGSTTRMRTGSTTRRPRAVGSPTSRAARARRSR